MEPHLTSKVNRATLTTSEVAWSPRIERADIEGEVRLEKAIGSASGFVTDRSTLPRFASSLHWLSEDYDGSEFLSSLYKKLLSLLAGRHGSVSEQLRMICEENTKLASNLIILFQCMDSAELRINDDRTPLDLLQHHSLPLPQKVHRRLEGPFRPTKDRKMDNMIDDYGLSNSNTSFSQSTAIYYTARSRPLDRSPFQTLRTQLCQCHRQISAWRTFRPFFSLHPNLRLYLKTKARPSGGHSVLIALVFRFMRQSLPPLPDL